MGSIVSAKVGRHQAMGYQPIALGARAGVRRHDASARLDGATLYEPLCMAQGPRKREQLGRKWRIFAGRFKFKIPAGGHATTFETIRPARPFLALTA